MRDSPLLRDIKRKQYLDAVRKRLFHEKMGAEAAAGRCTGAAESLAVGQRQPRQQHTSDGGELTEEERAVAMQLQATRVLASIGAGLGMAANLTMKLRLLNYDTAQLAVISGRLGSMISLCHLVLSPTIGSL